MGGGVFARSGCSPGGVAELGGAARYNQKTRVTLAAASRDEGRNFYGTSVSLLDSAIGIALAGEGLQVPVAELVAAVDHPSLANLAAISLPVALADNTVLRCPHDLKHLHHVVTSCTMGCNTSATS